jgi:hypothetical protein
MIAAALAAALGWAAPAAAHCDTLDGPVVAAARKALATGEVEHALIWVRKGDEHLIRTAFATTRTARSAGGRAAGEADTAFYATLVRVHRRGEGAPFTGLKPAGEVEPPVRAADAALATGRFADVEQPVVARVQAGLHERYAAVTSRRGFAPADVEAGRAYVGAYVEYVHHVERLYAAAAPADDAPAAHGTAHAHDPAPAHAH